MLQLMQLRRTAIIYLQLTLDGHDAWELCLATVCPERVVTMIHAAAACRRMFSRINRAVRWRRTAVGRRSSD